MQCAAVGQAPDGFFAFLLPTELDPAFGLRLDEHPVGLVDLLRQRHRSDVHVLTVPLEPGEIEDRFQCFEQLIRSLLDQPGQPLILLREEVFDDFGITENGGERRPDVVTHIRQKRSFGAVGGLSSITRPPQFLLLLNVLGDIGMRSEPPDHGATVIADRQRPREEPAVGTVVPAEQKGVFPRIERFEMRLPFLEHPIELVRMMKGSPSPPARFFQR